MRAFVGTLAEHIWKAIRTGGTSIWKALRFVFTHIWKAVRTVWKNKWKATRAVMGVLWSGRQWTAAGVVTLVAVLLAVAHRWPFDATPAPVTATDTNPSVWSVLLGDSITLGFTRLGIAMLGIFVIASVPALIVSGRWLKGFGSSGLTADDAKEANSAVDDLKRDLATAQNEAKTNEAIAERAFRVAEQLQGSLTETVAQLDESTDLVERLQAERDALKQELASLHGQVPG